MDYKVINESNDRKYFTIVPNYVLNHSSAIDQALYLQMKRVAGEDGLCFITQKHLCKKLGIGKDKLRASLQYLIKHEWIEFVGTTESKTRPINTYKINDIWNLNAEFYREKKISPKSALSFNEKDKARKTIDKTCISPKIRPETDPIRRTLLRRTIKKNTKYSSLKDIQESDLIEISQKYKVSLGFVKLKLETLKNYCEAKGRRYKNYKSALRNFVLGDMQKQVERRQDDTKRGIDARNI